MRGSNRQGSIIIHSLYAIFLANIREIHSSCL